MGRPSAGDRTAILLRLPTTLVTDIDGHRGVMTRTAWLEQAARAALDPINIYREPALDTTVHRCKPGTLVGTTFKGGVKIKTYRCADADCELEVTA